MYFLLFIASLTCYMVLGISINLAYIDRDTATHPNLQVMYVVLYMRIIFQSLVALLELLFLLSMLYLLWTQVSNLFLDMTTFERFTLGRVQRGNTNTRKVSLVQRMVWDGWVMFERV